MVEALIGLAGVLFGTIGLEIFRKFFNRRRDRTNDLVVVLQELRKDYARVKESRSEYETEIEAMGAKILALTSETENKLTQMQTELTNWRDKYYGVLDQLIETQHELHRFLKSSDKLDKS